MSLLLEGLVCLFTSELASTVMCSSQLASPRWLLVMVPLAALVVLVSDETPCGAFDLHNPETFDSSETRVGLSQGLCSNLLLRRQHLGAF